jgi:hypothetical protein
MLQVLHTDVAKVDQDVAHVAIAIHVCCKRLFEMFHPFQTRVARVLSGCCICFTQILHAFVLNVSFVSYAYCSEFFFCGVGRARHLGDAGAGNEGECGKQRYTRHGCRRGCPENKRHVWIESLSQWQISNKKFFIIANREPL